MIKKILLIDDDKSIRSLLSTLLELEGFEVIKDIELSIDGVLKKIKLENPDVILMDVHIQEIDGIEILKLVRIDPELAKSRIIMSSGLDLRDKCIAAGANGFLMKPYMPAELLEIIK
ncbi:MAG: response regulator [Anaerolineaceae bacterium]